MAETEPTSPLDAQSLLDRIAALEAQLAPKPASDTRMLDINDVRVPYVFRAFPQTLYKRGGKKGQVDHPGNITIDAKNAAHLEELTAAGWSATPYPAPEPSEDEPAKKAGKK